MAKVEKKKYRYILASSHSLGMRFKAWCATEGLSINKGLNLLMKYAVKGNFEHKEVLKKRKKAKA